MNYRVLNYCRYHAVWNCVSVKHIVISRSNILLEPRPETESRCHERRIFYFLATKGEEPSENAFNPIWRVEDRNGASWSTAIFHRTGFSAYYCKKIHYIFQILKMCHVGGWNCNFIDYKTKRIVSSWWSIQLWQLLFYQTRKSIIDPRDSLISIKKGESTVQKPVIVFGLIFRLESSEALPFARSDEK